MPTALHATLSTRRHGWPIVLPAPCTPPCYTASLTEPIVDFATNVIGDLGLAGIFVLMLLDSACIPTSSEAIMLFAGFEVSDGRFTMFEIVIAGAAGQPGRILDRVGHRLVRPRRAAREARQVAAHHAQAPRLGGPLVRALRRRRPCSSRGCCPVIRTFISLPAGVARMPFWKFTFLSIAGIIPWVLAFALVGRGGRGPLGRVAAEPALRGLRDPRGDRRRDHLPAVAPPPRAAQARG